MWKTVLKFLGVVAALAPVVAGAWYVATHESFAQQQAAEQTEIEATQRKVVEAVETLTAIRVQQETTEQAEAKLREQLCRAGKLEGADCSGD